MPRIGNLYLGGRTSDQTPFSSGVAFKLAKKSPIDFTWESQDHLWQTELAKDHEFIVSRTNNVLTLDSLQNLGLEQIQCCLDIITVEKLHILLLDHPELYRLSVINRNGSIVVQHFIMYSISFSMKVKVEVRDKNGNIKPDPPKPKLNWEAAFRYYRLSQASNDIYEAYRNLFLSFEAMLNSIHAKKIRQNERDWIKEALTDIGQRIDLKQHAPKNTKDSIAHFMTSQYDNVRCRLFHAKYPLALLPHSELSLDNLQSAYYSLLRLWRNIADVYFNVRTAGGAITYYGFKFSMDENYKRPFSFQFTEDNTIPKETDTQSSPLGLPVYTFDEAEYLSETHPGIVSMRGKTKISKAYENLNIHRICSLTDNHLLNIDLLINGLNVSGADIFETYHSLRLANSDQPKISF